MCRMANKEYLYFKLAMQKKSSAVQPNLQNSPCSHSISLILTSFPVLLQLFYIHFIINKFSDFLSTSVKYLQVHDLINMPVREAKSLHNL